MLYEVITLRKSFGRFSFFPVLSVVRIASNPMKSAGWFLWTSGFAVPGEPFESGWVWFYTTPPKDLTGWQRKAPGILF